MNKFDDTFLARWLNGSLIPEELQKFESSKDYESYSKIINATGKFKSPVYNENELFSKINSGVSNKKRARKRFLQFAYGTAASIVFILSIFYFTNNSNTSYKTTYGEQMVKVLPDGSEITLNANTGIDYNKEDWDKNRTVYLKGEAYFKVKKGVPFKVVSTQGSVEVLGTEFNVNTNNNYLEVKCYTGKVKVTNNQKIANFLTKGKAHRTFNDKETLWTFNVLDVFWKKGKSSFNRTPFPLVIKALENQFNIKVENTKAYENEIFTGRFSNNNLNLALKTIFSAMQINYTVKGNTIQLLNK